MPVLNACEFENIPIKNDGPVKYVFLAYMASISRTRAQLFKASLAYKLLRGQLVKCLMIIPPAYEVCHGGIMFLSFLCVCVRVSVNNFRVCSITLKPHDIFS